MQERVQNSEDGASPVSVVEMNITGEPATVFGRVRQSGSQAGEWQVLHRGGQGPYLCVGRGPTQQGAGETTGEAGGLLIEPIADAAVIAAARWASARAQGDGRLIETGIKAIDLLCPLVDGGTTAILGGPRQGRVVLLRELYARLSGHDGRQALVFLIDESVAIGVPEMIAADPDFPPDQAGGLITVWAVSPRAPEADFVDAGGPWTTRLLFSADEAARGNYPALDLMRSQCFAGTCWRDEDHRRVAKAAREVLATPDNPRALRLRAYLTQAFYVTAASMGCPGSSVPLAKTIEDCAAILAGDLDHEEPRALRMIGGIGATAAI